LLNDPSKNEHQDFFGFLFILFYFLIYGFSTQFPNIISKASTLCSAKLLGEEDPKFVDHVLQGVKKSSPQYFAIYVVNFFEKNSTHYFNSLRQDPIVGSQK
jgi:hypothetical protein